jgi:hypothetical protein
LCFKQFDLRLIQLPSQFCVDAFAFSLLLLTERLLCLGARFEELSAQTLDELEGVIEHISPVVERLQYNSLLPKRRLFLFSPVQASKKLVTQLILLSCLCQEQKVPCNIECPSML